MTNFRMTYRKQIRTVFLIQLAILLIVGGVAFLFWTSVCDSDRWGSCVGSSDYAPFLFVIYAVIRPLLATPVMIISLIAGDTFGVLWGTFFAAAGATASCLLLYLPAKYIGRIYVKPFLSANLPATWQLVRTQDYKVVFITRWIPIFPFDFFSILFGAADFRFKSVLLATFFGVIPECFMFARISLNPTADLITSTVSSLTVVGLAALAPLFIYEILSRKQGGSLWTYLKSCYRELIFEIRANNEIVRHEEYDPHKVPVILLYGFFSSRRSLTVLERILQARGFQVMSFNLGGMFGVFFTRGIKETAKFIDVKIKRQLMRHGFKNIHIVAHSKGGLVALWWLMKLGGSQYCSKVVTMGTPFRGSRYTYLALITPLGFIWRDVWQMRPGSEFLDELHSFEVPEQTEIYCMYSEKDSVARGRQGIFRPKSKAKNISPVAMNHIGHFEFLYRRDVGDVIAKLLGRAPEMTSEKGPERANQQRRIKYREA